MATPTESEVEAYLSSVETMKSKGQLGDEDYYKCLVSLAWEFINLGGQGERRAYALLNKVNAKSPDYWAPSGIGYKQAMEDTQYGVIVIKLAFKLLQYGLVGGDENIYGATQKPAEA
jgi:hypothetical protein